VCNTRSADRMSAVTAWAMSIGEGFLELSQLDMPVGCRFPSRRIRLAVAQRLFMTHSEDFVEL
jgi:hypothetical protein